MDYQNHKNWIGIDLDGTLAEYKGRKGNLVIGKPIPRIVEFIKAVHAKGKRIKIFTARTSKESLDGFPQSMVVRKIQEWCAEYLGFRPEVTCEKDKLKVCSYDDTAFRVVKNEGILMLFIENSKNSKKDETLNNFLTQK